LIEGGECVGLTSWDPADSTFEYGVKVIFIKKLFKKEEVIFDGKEREEGNRFNDGGDPGFPPA
jgi:hypothetical protein